MADSVVVIDCGSEQIKAGLAGRAAPEVVFPPEVARPRLPGQAAVLVGEKAHAKAGSGSVTSSRPIKDGKVVDWDGFAALYRHALRAWPEAAASGGVVVVVVQHRDLIAEQGDRLVQVARLHEARQPGLLGVREHRHVTPRLPAQLHQRRTGERHHAAHTRPPGLERRLNPGRHRRPHLGPVTPASPGAPGSAGTRRENPTRSGARPPRPGCGRPGLPAKAGEPRCFSRTALCTAQVAPP
ncbi:hypothetical protein [Streptomyces sp. NPDC060031]|uniref:hypothetical protein n=1 Tax=Streptomyces sp. NPDC060031 TaxID=3347043 RepID=UPI003697268A